MSFRSWIGPLVALIVVIIVGYLNKRGVAHIGEYFLISAAVLFVLVVVIVYFILKK